MRVLSVNVGKVRAIQNGKPSGQTGIFKEPVAVPVYVTTEGLAGDAICDTENHGGVDQAVYVFGAKDYEWWANSLGQPLLPGMFGENLTISDLESGTLFVGDQFQVGEVVLEVTAPRIPCVTLAARMQDKTFLKTFRAAERPGVYCRVLQEGRICAGDPVAYQSYRGDRISVSEMFREFFEPDHSEATLNRYLNAPIAIRDRQYKEGLLRELRATQSDKKPGC
ncbi:MAG: MOSC domain-containing protein [Anaerolineales bacterium]|nr:MOSC domain-containing protein [Anaerolineales bacterium]